MQIYQWMVPLHNQVIGNHKVAIHLVQIYRRNPSLAIYVCTARD
jgi:hypothetical protein